MPMTAATMAQKVCTALDGVSATTGADALKAKVKAAIDAVPVPLANAGEAEAKAYSDDLLVAMCKGIVEGMFSSASGFRTSLIQAICNGVIQEITSMALVTVNTTVTTTVVGACGTGPVSGSGTGTGTGTGTIA